MKCHKCVNLIKDYNATETDKTFLYKCLKKNKWGISTEDLRYGLGEMKPYYCKGDYIRLDENGNITSKNRQKNEQQYRLEENNQTDELILWENAKILNVFKSTYDNRKHLNAIVDRLNEQQDTIDKQELRIQHLEELLELSENLNDSYREKLIDMNLKMVMKNEH